MKVKSIGLLLVIVLTGAFFRFFGLNWDQGFHLHPDERFLTMVGITSRIPGDFFIYLNPIISPLNPTNNNFPFFVYGIFPVTLVKLLAVFFHMDTYDSFTILGRIISAIFDTAIIILVFLIGQLLVEKYHFDKKIPLLAALFYAIAVFPIQLAHFFTVDIFLDFFSFLSVYFILLYEKDKKNIWPLVSAMSLGIALACKLSALAMTPLLLAIIITTTPKHILRIATVIGTFVLVMYLSLRLADPYIFASSNIFHLEPNNQFVSSITTLSSYNNPNVWYPPGVQWIHKTPVLFSLVNIFFFGLGPLYFLLCCLGIFFLMITKKVTPIVITIWAIAFFLYQSTQYVKTMRYFIFLYPFFALFAAIGYSFLSKKLAKYTVGLLGVIILIWPLLFINLYTKPHTRVEASYWIQKHIPANSTILTEYWDDPLPLHITGVEDKQYRIIELPVFDMDTNEKWDKIRQAITESNYFILSSNRGWGSIATVPQRYPKMTKFYKDLFSEKLSFKKVAEFTSYPSLSYLGIPVTIPDDAAEEAFTVFDHPKVLIFKKE